MIKNKLSVFVFIFFLCLICFSIITSPISFYAGIIETLNTMGGGMKVWFGILILYIGIPVLLTPVIGSILRKIGWIKDGDLKLDLV